MTTHPEQAVLDAIDGLEQDEIGELVRWQIEEGIRRGDHLPERYLALSDPAETVAQHLRADHRLSDVSIHTRFGLMERVAAMLAAQDPWQRRAGPTFEAWLPDSSSSL